MKKRLVAAAFSLVAIALAFGYLPTWREKLVFTIAMLGCKVVDTAIGADVALQAMRDLLSKEAP